MGTISVKQQNLMKATNDAGGPAVDTYAAPIAVVRAGGTDPSLSGGA